MSAASGRSPLAAGPARRAARVPAIVLVVLTALAIALPARAQEAEKEWAAANELYRAVKYEEAARAYERIAANGFESPALYYNLGNAWYKAGNVPAAILNYERAKRLAPGDEDILHNLRLANLRIVDRIEPIPRLFFVEWWEELVGAASASGWGTLAIASLWAGVVLLAAFRVLRGTIARRSTLFPGIALLSLAAFAFTAGAIQGERETSEHAAILFAASAPVKSAPDAGSTDLFVLHEGVRVDLLDAVGDWRKIRLADGKIGWLPLGDLRVI